MAGGMQAQDYFGARRPFDAQALGADGDASIGAHFDEYANAPNIGPPGTARGRTQDGSFFFLGGIPSPLRGLAQFAMDLLGIAMVAERVEVPTKTTKYF